MERQPVSGDTLFKIGFGVGLYFVVIKPILETLNVVDTATEKKERKLIEKFDTSEFWSPNYWKKLSTTGKVKLTKKQTALDLAKRIYESKKFFNDDENKLYSVFRLINYQTQVSWVAFNFDLLYQSDMWNYIKSFTNREEQAEIIKLIAAKPLGYTKEK